MHQSLLFPHDVEASRTPVRNQRGPRQDLEQYFTPFWVPERIIQRFFSDLGPRDFVVDSGSGRGAWISAIPSHVPAVAVEIDPALAAETRRMSGRDVILGDFRTIALPQDPTVVLGNPPFRLAHDFLQRAYEVLPENGRCGYILPTTTFGFCGPFRRLADKWSIRYELLPRQIFPRARFSFVFALFTKELVRTYSGFFLFDEAAALADAPGRVRMVLMHGRPHRSVWRALIEDAIDAFGGKATRLQIKGYIAPRRSSRNPFWEARVREVINNSGAFIEDADGVARAA